MKTSIRQGRNILCHYCKISRSFSGCIYLYFSYTKPCTLLIMCRLFYYFTKVWNFVCAMKIYPNKKKVIFLISPGAMRRLTMTGMLINLKVINEKQEQNWDLLHMPLMISKFSKPRSIGLWKIRFKEIPSNYHRV